MIVVDGPEGKRAVDFAPDAFTAALTAALGDIAPSGVVGLIGETSPAMLKAWHTCLGAGYVPVMLQQPTQKLSHLYWATELTQAVRTLGIDLLVCLDRHHDPAAGVPVISLDTLPAPAPAAESSGALTIAPEARLLQLSSGTTGHRKGIGFRFADVVRHAHDYNQVLGLTPDDCLVSWLPLYHDMGFIAAFLITQIVGCRLVLIDPMRWLRDPARLFALIERHGGTTCFLPNFAFEVLVQRGRPRPLPSMRRWISCSEPTRLATMRRFLDATGTPPDRLVNCYGMAENIFAVCQSSSIKSATIDGETVLSCGPPIPGTEVKVVDGEIFVRSPYSLRAYVGGDAPVDADGFYASGDLGALIDGEIYLTGRRHDVVIHAGQKFLLSDLDHKLDGETRSGRVASFGIAEPTLGTETIVGLIEQEAFWTANRDTAKRAELARASGVETAQIHFVPPRFITKTSSGKVNRRRTAGHWAGCLAERAARRGEVGTAPRDQVEREIRETFTGLELERPIGDQLDSLGLVNLHMILSRADPDVHLDPARSVASYLVERPAGTAHTEVLKVVSLCDQYMLRQALPPHLQVLWMRYRLPLQIRHVCAPIAKALLSDLIFMDYFMARDERLSSRAERTEAYAGVMAAHHVIRDASVLLVDDMTQLYWQQAYPVLSHDFRATPEAQLLGVRWAQYSSRHHLLACELLRETPAYRAEAGAWIDRLADYLGVPVIKIAFRAEAAAYTQDWDVACRIPIENTQGLLSRDQIFDFGNALVPVLDRTLDRAPRRAGEPTQFIDTQDQVHWCSWVIKRELVDFIIDRYDDILVLGSPSSVPYLAAECARRGKRVTYRASLDAAGDFDCVVQLGSWGKPETDKPLFTPIGAGWSDQVAHNVPDTVRAACPPLDPGWAEPEGL